LGTRALATVQEGAAGVEADGVEAAWPAGCASMGKGVAGGGGVIEGASEGVVALRKSSTLEGGATPAG